MARDVLGVDQRRFRGLELVPLDEVEGVRRDRGSDGVWEREMACG